jgi:hypothetical protein
MQSERERLMRRIERLRQSLCDYHRNPDRRPELDGTLREEMDALLNEITERVMDGSMKVADVRVWSEAVGLQLPRANGAAQ